MLFLFFSAKIEWVGLLEHHPELFEAAKKYEKFDEKTGKRFTWSEKESLDEIEARKDEIKAKFTLTPNTEKKKTLMQAVLENDEDDDGCLICML